MSCHPLIRLSFRDWFLLIPSPQPPHNQGFQFFRQPQLVAYICAGIILGPSGLGFIDDIKTIEHLGALGVTLLLFFIGMEVSPMQLARGWRIAVIGTLLQIVISVLIVWIVGLSLGWSMARIVLLGFVISLSSTAVVLNDLRKTFFLRNTGQNTPGAQGMFLPP